MGRIGVSLACAFALAALVSVCAAPAARATVDRAGAKQRAAAPSLTELSGPSAGSLVDVERSGLVARTHRLDSAWNGGVYTTEAGESFHIYASSYYVDDDSVRQSWVGFFAWLVHGSELPRLTVYQAPLFQVQEICGAGAEACYSPAEQTMVVPGDRQEVNMSQAAAHEYGHHIAANRSNFPWDANSWGTKYWATYANVCQRVAQGSAVPGDEGANYEINPGEAFADTYRFAMGVYAAGGGDWNTPSTDPFLAPSFPNDAGAYGALLRDVQQPWTAPQELDWPAVLTMPTSTHRVRTTVMKHGKKAVITKVVKRPIPGAPPKPTTYLLSTPDDGLLSVTIRSAPRDATLGIFDAAGVTPLAPVGVTSINFTICGQRQVLLRLSAASGGAASIHLSVP